MDDRLYTVKKGDSLWKIADELMGLPSAWPLLMKYNEDKISNSNLIFPGQVLALPPEWIKPKITSPRPIKVNLSVKPPKDERQVKFAGAYEARLVPDLVIDTPNVKFTIKFLGKVVLAAKASSPSTVEISNTGITASSEQKVHAAFSELVRKVEVKLDPKTKKISLKSTLTIPLSGSSGITVSHNAEFSKNGLPTYIYEVNLPNEVKCSYKDYDVIAKDYKYLVEAEYKPNPDEGKSSGLGEWVMGSIMVIGTVALVAVAIYYSVISIAALFPLLFASVLWGVSTQANASTVDGDPFYIKYNTKNGVKSLRIRSFL